MSAAFRISIGANVVLLGVLAFLILRDSPSTPPPATSTPAPSSPTRPFESQKTTAVAKEIQPRIAGQKLDPATVAQLEKMGISREVLADAVIENLNRKSTKRVVELQKKYAPRLVPDREMLEFARQSDVERVREIKQTLGEDGYRAWDKEQTLRELNRARVPGDELQMSADEAEQAYRLQKDFDEKARDLQMAMEDGVADRADVGSLQAQAQQALDNELEKLLGKQRFNELKGNTEPTTEVYRAYGDLKPTPDQANAVVQAEAAYRDKQAALSQRLGQNPADTATTLAALKALDDAQDASLRQIFGADAYDNVKRQNDSTYKTLKQFADAWDLKENEIQSAYSTLHALDDQTARMRAAAEMSQNSGQHVNWRDINTQIEQTRQQAETSLQNQLGAERVRRLKQNGLLGAQ